MQATDLFMNLLATQGGAQKTDGLFSLKNADKGSNGSLFQATFNRALESRFTPDRGTANANDDSSPIGNANFTQKQDFAAEQERPRIECTARTQSAYRQNTPAARAEKSETAASQDAPASQTATVQQTDPAGTTGETSDAAAELKTRVAQLEAAADGDDAIEVDGQMQQLLLDLLALLLTGKGDEDALKQLAANLGLENIAPLDGLKLTFALGGNTELSNALAALIEQMKEAGAGQDALKLLVRLNDEKAIQISVSELIGSADSGSQESNQLQLLLGAQGEDQSFTLKLTPEEVAGAQLVDLPDEMKGAAVAILAETEQASGPKQTEIALLVPAELVDSEEITADLSRIAFDTAKADQSAEKAAGAKPGLVIPLAVSNQSANPEITTADAQFLQSDAYLRRLDLEALAKELAEARTPRAELAARLERLIGSTKPGDTYSAMLLNGKDSSFDFLKNLFTGFNGNQQQQQDQQQQWQPDLFKGQLKAELTADRAGLASTAAETAGERVQFLGRPASSVQNIFQQAMNQVSETRTSRTGTETYQAVLDQITSRIQYAALSANGSEMKIFIRPEHLGDVQLKVRVDQDVVVAKFVAHSQEVKAIIESSLNQLRDALAEAGIKAGKIVVTLGNGQGGQQQTAPESGKDTWNNASWSDLSAMPADELAAADEALPLMDDIIYSTRPTASAASRYSYLA